MAANTKAPLWWLRVRWVRAIAAVPLVILAIPLAAIAGIWQWWKGGASTSPQELADMLRRVSKGTGWDSHRGEWDELDSVPLRDARLEAIRKEACAVWLPLTPEGRAKLDELASRADALSQL